MLKHFAKVIKRIEGQITGWSAPSSDNESAPRYLLAVSGGADSMCLADLCLRTLGKERFEVAHCNFHLRGEESDGDESLVTMWAETSGVVLHRKDFDTEGHALNEGISIEMAARDLRYAWFAELCNERGLCGVMTAHNANDNAETMILNLLRGSGLRGVSGMDEVSALSTGRRTVNVFRPLLSFTRVQIEGYAFAWNIAYRNDSTNALSDYKRNRIRNEVFPHFFKINPSFVNTLNREAGYFAEADEIVEEWCSSRVQKCMADSKDHSISVPSLMEEPHWRYLLYHMLSPYGFHSATIASIENLLASDRTVSGKRFEAEEYVLITERDRLVIVRKDDNPGDMDSQDVIMPVRGPGIFNFNGSRFKVEVIQWTPDMQVRQPDGVIVMDAGRLTFPFVCRKWNRGDWFKPIGLKGRKKISDLFADLKYDSFAKESAIMIIDCSGKDREEGHVAAVLGVRIDEAFKLTSSTVEAVRISPV